MKQSLRKKLASFLLLIVTLSVTLLACEYIVRAYFPQRLYFNISQWDPYVGFTAIPNIEGFSRHEDFTMLVKINSRGLRDEEYPYTPPPNTLRIGVFGDSFTFGEGVQNDETYPQLLEKLLNNHEPLTNRGIHVEVLNFGLGKTGTSHQLAWYQKEGRKYNLDYVIVGFLPSNDFTDNWGGVFYLENDVLVHNPTAYSSIRKIQKIVYKIPFYRWLAANSHLVNLARKTATIIDDKLRRKKSESRHTSEDDSEAREKREKGMYDLTLRLMREFQKETVQEQSEFIVVNLATKHLKPLADYSPEDKMYFYAALDDALLKDLRRMEVPVIDLVPEFSKLPITDYYFEHDGHINPRGHEAVASFIYEALARDIDWEKVDIKD